MSQATRIKMKDDEHVSLLAVLHDYQQDIRTALHHNLMRIKVACLDNRTQLQTVVTLTVINASVWLIGHTLSAWWVLVAILMWPFFALVMRLTQPLQKQSNESSLGRRRPSDSSNFAQSSAKPMATLKHPVNQGRRLHPSKGETHVDLLPDTPVRQTR
jgi:hypothetical protein